MQNLNINLKDYHQRMVISVSQLLFYWPSPMFSIFVTTFLPCSFPLLVSSLSSFYSLRLTSLDLLQNSFHHTSPLNHSSKAAGGVFSSSKTSYWVTAGRGNRGPFHVNCCAEYLYKKTKSFSKMGSVIGTIGKQEQHPQNVLIYV